MPEADPGDHGVLATRKTPQHPARVRRIARLLQYLPIQYDNGVRAENNFVAILPGGLGLLARQAPRVSFRSFTRRPRFLHRTHADGELESGSRQQLAAARGLGGQDKIHFVRYNMVWETNAVAAAAAAYKTKLAQEQRFFKDYVEVHNLPGIFHYWSEKYVRPRLRAIGFDGSIEFMIDPIQWQCERNPGGGEMPQPGSRKLRSGNPDRGAASLAWVFQIQNRMPGLE
jgi:hypothetical protein